MVVCYLAHRLLNANAKVDEGARCAGVSTPVLSLLREHGATIRQMPCPELAFGGPRRFWAVREQYDTPALPRPLPAAGRAGRGAGAGRSRRRRPGRHHRHRRRPQHGRRADRGRRRLGRPPGKPRDEEYPVTPGAGVFTETLRELLGEDVGAVRAVGIGQDLFDSDEERELAKLGGILGGEEELRAR